MYYKIYFVFLCDLRYQSKCSIPPILPHKNLFLFGAEDT